MAGATLRLEGLRLVVDVGGARHVVPVGPLQAGYSTQGTTWGEAPGATWTELTLRLAPDGRLWVERAEWEDNQLAPSGTGASSARWFVSSDGAAWTPSAQAPAEPGVQLGRVST